MNKKIINDIYPEAVEKIEAGICPFCHKKVTNQDFDDEVSLKEFAISGLCQKCQDQIFKEDE